jgi:hypothetical protein
VISRFVVSTPGCSVLTGSSSSQIPYLHHFNPSPSLLTLSSSSRSPLRRLPSHCPWYQLWSCSLASSSYGEPYGPTPLKRRSLAYTKNATAIWTQKTRTIFSYLSCIDMEAHWSPQHHAEIPKDRIITTFISTYASLESHLPATTVRSHILHGNSTPRWGQNISPRYSIGTPFNTQARVINAYASGTASQEPNTTIALKRTSRTLFWHSWLTSKAWLKWYGKNLSISLGQQKQWSYRWWSPRA